MGQDRRASRFVLGTVVVLAISIAGFWGYRAGMTDGAATVRLSRTSAKMHDGTCVFVADFHLDSPLDRWSFGYHQEGIRAEIIEAMRTKSKYMVVTPSGQKGLQIQIANMANRIAGTRIAKNVTFDQFTLE